MSINRVLRKYCALPVQVKASFWVLICSFLQRGISIITTPIFTRLLDTAEFGKYNAFNSWYGILFVIISLYLFGGVHQQGLIKFEKERAVFTSSLQGLTTVLVLFWTVLYLLFHNYWNKLLSLSTVQVLALLLMVWTTAAFNFWTNEQRVDYKYKALVGVTLAVSLAKPIVGVFLVIHAEDKVTARILGLALVELIGYTGLFVVQMKRGKEFFSARFWKYALLFNLPLVPHYLSQTVLNSADRIMIQRMIGDSEAGIYSLAYSVSSIMVLFNTALSQTIGPWQYRKIKEKNTPDMAPVGYTTLIIIALVNLVLIVLGPEVVAIFAPKAYYEAIWVIPPVAMGALFLYSYDLFAKFAFYYEKTIAVMIISAFGAGLNILLNYYFINLFGYMAAGYTTLFCYIVYAVGNYMYMVYICRRYNNGIIPYETNRLILIATVFLGVGFLMIATYSHPTIRYCIVGIVLIMSIAFRKRIVAVMKDLISLRKPT